MSTPGLTLPPVAEDLRRLEPALRAAVVSGDAFLDEVTTHLIDAGGKRLRPALALAAATGLTGTATDDDIQGGVAVELVHLASLYHDDVIDEAVTRRNVESVNARFGNLVAIVAGDFLLARSAAIAASLGTEIAGLLATTLGRLCEGQLTEVRAAFSLARTEEEYLRTISGKTAALMACACRIGALTSGRGDEHLDALTRYGHALGMVFQVRDDILDVIGTEETLGKPAGQDIAEGVYTLPVLLALGDESVAPELRTMLGVPLDAERREQARAVVAASSGIAASVAVGRRFVADAVEAAADAPTRELAQCLTELAHSLLDGLPVPLG